MPLLADEWWHIYFIYFIYQKKIEVFLYLQMLSKKLPTDIVNKAKAILPKPNRQSCV